MPSSRPLILFTHHYPFGNKESFLETEIHYLSHQFSVTIVPSERDGPMRTIPSNVSIDTSFADTYCGKSKRCLLRKMLRALSYFPLYQELFYAPKKLTCLRKLLGYASEVQRCKRWLKKKLNKTPPLAQAIFYTYWLYDHTTALIQMKKHFPGMSVVSRTHGFDLYEENYHPAYIPFRRICFFDKIDRIFPISVHGQRYLTKRFPPLKAKLRVCRLGVSGSVITPIDKSDAVLRLVSCSHIVPLKRLGLQIKGIAAFANQHPAIQVEWQHIGDGLQKDRLAEYAAKLMPASVKWTFVGALNNQEVCAFYAEYRPDLILLMSETEGLPVSLMEAYACGIPAIATDVGGVGEIVNAENGYLLPAHPTEKDIAQALATFINGPDKLRNAKHKAYQTWCSFFRADNNYQRFVELLTEL